jgi:branched-subunit amino acid transport protein
MNGMTYLLALAAGSWALRVAFIVLIPAERLPERVTAALGHTAPAVLASLVSVETVTGLKDDGGDARLAVVAALIAITTVAARRPNLALSAGLGVASALLIDLVLVR